MKSEIKKDKDELAKLRVAAKEGLEAMEKVDELKKRDKELSEENKTLAENFNSERVSTNLRSTSRGRKSILYVVYEIWLS